MREAVVVKIGGSVSSNLSAIVSDLKDCIRIKVCKKIIIVPGGWIFADMVRKLGIDGSTAHWMAVASIDIYGYYISSFGAELVDSDDFNFNIDGVAVMLLHRLLRRYDELPHSWDVTSDSISIWLAEKLGVKEVVKLTDVDGVIIDGKIAEKVCVEELMNIETCIDKCSPFLMKKYRINMFVCNGLKNRVKDYILRGQAVGTLIDAHADK